MRYKRHSRLKECVLEFQKCHPAFAGWYDTVIDMWKALWKARPIMIYHTYSNAWAWNPLPEVLLSLPEASSDRKEDCQIHEYHQEIAFGYD